MFICLSFSLTVSISSSLYLPLFLSLFLYFSLYLYHTVSFYLYLFLSLGLYFSHYLSLSLCLFFVIALLSSRRFFFLTCELCFYILSLSLYLSLTLSLFSLYFFSLSLPCYLSPQKPALFSHRTGTDMALLILTFSLSNNTLLIPKLALFLKLALPQNWHSDMASQLVEVTTLLDLETAVVERLSRNRDNLLGLLKSLDADRLLKERLEIETLGDAGIVRHKKNFHTKQIKVKTKLL